MQHCIMRTSPKGGKFFGTCTLCGEENLPGEAALEDCPNIRGLTMGEALVEVLEAGEGNGTEKRST